jgi:hypothetical protein
VIATNGQGRIDLKPTSWLYYDYLYGYPAALDHPNPHAQKENDLWSFGAGKTVAGGR